MTNSTDIREIKGVGEKTALLFNKVGIHEVGDALAYYPRGYERFDAPLPLSELRETLAAGEAVLATVAGTVSGTVRQKRVRHLTIINFSIKEGGDTLHLTYFNMPYLSKMIKPGNHYIFRGRVEKKGEELHMEQGKLYKEKDYQPLVGSLQPRYPLTAGLTNHAVTKTIKQIFNGYVFPPDYLPNAIKEKYGLPDYPYAIHKIHFPDNFEDVAAARRRLVFDEFFLFIVAVRRLREQTLAQKSDAVMLEVAQTGRLLEALPYRLTAAQERAWAEIDVDLTGQYVMSRLVQGDVGSGKTIIAFLALLMCVANGYQGALMAPTEVLAAQHYKTLQNMCERYRLPIRPVLLTGSVKAAAKREAHEKIASGEVNVVVGTHALIQEKVAYRNLALVVTDEQHRFGVRQREALAGKGQNVHVLVMSATPIPRTLAIIIYGDLALSVIDELPAHRLPIKNCVVGTNYREAAYRHIIKEVEAGHQAYVICPMIEEGEMDGLENVTDYTAKLRARLPEQIEVAALHGKMPPAEKNRLMADFASGNIDVLVSTTVIEVGVDVPNATVMVVENAERFGLAQLHQLRGRVGRGEAQSYCVFISGQTGEETMKRLEILNQSNDGFHIASEDLKLRGSGDIFGVRQSGLADFHLGDIYQDAEVLKEAAEAAEAVLAQDPELTEAENAGLREYVENGMRKFIDFRSI
ncbi:MAG: ATP-dependent DNA helicase RecG [Lachnospiraceae bacterium]|jgi:ATP-dependent DNA helicase RecG|nr:ATP-dependent DNA helicase RecG [Lachnospiraceae bacterium]